MIKKDISLESWREYEWIIPETGMTRTVIIINPISLYYEKGSSCHIITKEVQEPTPHVVAYCVPSVGRYGCVLTWSKDNDEEPVLFVSASKEDES